MITFKDEILSRPVFGNNNSGATNSNKIPTTNKIVISPSSLSTTDGDDQMLQVKEEEISDDENDDGQNSMDYDGNELRPEDLLSVIEAENGSDVQIKEEPMEVSAVVETKNNEWVEKSITVIF